MTTRMVCLECSRQLQIQAEWAGRKVKCPHCRAIVEVPAAELALPVEESTDPYSLAEPESEARPLDPEPAPPPKVIASSGAECPYCQAPIHPQAVLCVSCGFNFKTGKQLKTVAKRFQRHWDSADFSYWARLVVFIICLPLGALPMLFGEFEVGVVTLFLWGLVFLQGLGTLKRIIITREADGQPILIRQWWVCFVPVARVVTPLEDYKRLRTGLAEGGLDWASVPLVIGLFLLFGLPGILYVVITRSQNKNVVQLEIAGDHTDDLEPILVYRGRSEDAMRQIGDSFKEITNMRYG